MRHFLCFLAGVLAVFSLRAADEFALVTVPVANLRATPSHSGELLSQGGMGTPLHVRGQQGEWLAVTMPDGYPGYMIDNAVVRLDSAALARWQQAPRAVVTVLATRIATGTGADASTVSPLQLNDIVEVRDTTADGFMLAVSLPDGRSGFLPAAHARPFFPFGTGPADAQAVIAMGMQLLGQEYLWGGTSAKAADCSGFTRVLFASQGIYLPRDAWQQARDLPRVSRSELMPGDLVFFSNAKRRVNHVGIYIGDGRMLHCSGRVRIDRIFGTGAESDAPLYGRMPSSFGRPVTGEPLPGDTTANFFYFK